MIDSSHDITPFDGATPRREAVRAIGAAGTALLGVVGLGAVAPSKGKSRSVGADQAIGLIGLTSSISEPFSLGANEGITKRAACPDGFIAISGGLQGDSEVTASCMIRESRTEPDGSAWVVNVFCTEATNTALRVGAICLSRSSFKLVAQ